jgi:hypothetical protein
MNYIDSTQCVVTETVKKKTSNDIDVTFHKTWQFLLVFMDLKESDERRIVVSEMRSLRLVNGVRL